MSRKPGLCVRKRDSGTTRRFDYFGMGGRLVGVGTRVSLARDPDDWRYSMRIDGPACHEQGLSEAVCVNRRCAPRLRRRRGCHLRQGSLTRAFPSHDYGIDQD
jgi:hypothetical protein